MLCLAAHIIASNAIVNASTIVFRRELAIAAGSANEDYTVAGDWDFWVRLLVRSKVAFVATPLNYFRNSWQDGSR